MEVLVSYVSGKIPAGFPSPAADHLENRIDLNKWLIQNELSTFICESEGSSMINAFIPHKANLIVDKSLTPKNGDIIVGVLNGEFTIKYFKKNDSTCFLVPANSKFPAIKITEEMDFQVWGVVTRIIINPSDVKCMV